ncbi:cysteine methyltransferase [Mucilaginibacter sp. HC2]|uniref:MGMT family protein n=1 Tax=Mucilaginibacter inviolabilis TaxID=2714892 RepID=UPI00140997B5|nr:MGMT family protein [Mucilaginibacter inviolabilis]NHA05147.1 cysteine methyltransferase [Mucilaginibacter inviolabilis]
MDTRQFNDDVFQVVELIPTGRVTSYGAIAKALGYGTARMVGHAMGMIDHENKTLPAHRVVNSSGHISPPENSGGKWRIQMLEQEGVAVHNGKVVKFKELFWDPKIEIE